MVATPGKWPENATPLQVLETLPLHTVNSVNIVRKKNKDNSRYQ